ncbi:bifunctional DNA primase/polymerase [Saccharothrix sp. NRRL B-16314]|uniref:bifunctional DNA primase/polymerase n=1 Tax=Saccharothrix sp. NRRL B-16314 TaxID=1463825 RepID=UPI0005252AD6|nr:bifunctional DNA primase/polymerase [Saccharothrix sp. NRRL B-16314]
MSDRNDLLTAALGTAARGWPVFPLVPGGKRPAVKNWEQRATTDPDRIRRCWTHGPAYNIGQATGPAGLLVVDLDVAKPDKPDPDGFRHGLEVLALLADDARQPLPTDTRTVTTPSGGMHLTFTAPAEVEYRNTAGKLGRLIDTRAHGGYVVAPGSVIDDRTYDVTNDAPVLPLPAWIGTLLRPAPLPPPPPAPVPLRTSGGDRRGKYLRAAIDAEVARVEGATGGERNAALYIAAQALGQLVAGGQLTEHEVRDTLLHAAAGHLAVNAYSHNTADKTITSGLRAGARRPRKVAA